MKRKISSTRLNTSLYYGPICSRTRSLKRGLSLRSRTGPASSDVEGTRSVTASLHLDSFADVGKGSQRMRAVLCTGKVKGTRDAQCGPSQGSSQGPRVRRTRVKYTTLVLHGPDERTPTLFVRTLTRCRKTSQARAQPTGHLIPTQASLSPSVVGDSKRETVANGSSKADKLAVHHY